MLDIFKLASFLENELNSNPYGMIFRVATYSKTLDTRSEINDSGIRQDFIPAIITTPTGAYIPINAVHAERLQFNLELLIPMSYKDTWVNFVDSFVWEINGKLYYLANGEFLTEKPLDGEFTTVKITLQTPSFGAVGAANFEVWEELNNYIPELSNRRSELFIAVNMPIAIKTTKGFFVGDEFKLFIAEKPTTNVDYAESTQSAYEAQKDEFKTTYTGEATTVSAIIAELNSQESTKESHTFVINDDATSDGSFSLTLGGTNHTLPITEFEAGLPQVWRLNFYQAPTIFGSFHIIINGITRTFSIPPTGGSPEIVTLTVTLGTSNSGTISVTLDGVTKTTFALLGGLTADQTAQAIEALSFDGWNVERTDNVVVFTAIASEDKTGTFARNVGTTGAVININDTNGEVPSPDPTYTGAYIATLIANTDFPGFNMSNPSAGYVVFTATSNGYISAPTCDYADLGGAYTAYEDQIGQEDAGTSKNDFANALSALYFPNWNVTRSSQYAIKFEEVDYGTSNSMTNSYSGISLTIISSNGISGFGDYSNVDYYSSVNDTHYYFINEAHYLNLAYYQIKGIDLKFKNSRMPESEHYLNDNTAETFVTQNDVKYSISAYFENADIVIDMFRNLVQGKNVNKVYYTKLECPWNESIYRADIALQSDAITSVDDFALIPLMFTKAFKELL